MSHSTPTLPSLRFKHIGKTLKAQATPTPTYGGQDSAANLTDNNNDR